MNSSLIKSGKYMTNGQIMSLVERDRANMQQRLQYLSEVTNPLLYALVQIDTARQMLYTALLFRADPSWKVQLKILQDKFNSEVTTGQQAARKLLSDDSLAYVHEIIQPAEHLIMHTASRINQAITKAIGEDDGGYELQLLADKYASMANVFETHMKALGTDHLARDTRTSRAGVYIGVRANELEREGYTNVRQQWKTIYNELKANRHKLEGDQAEAWEYLEYKNPHGMRASEKRQFEQEISRLKRAAIDLT
jgi:hypothetical protein